MFEKLNLLEALLGIVLLLFILMALIIIHVEEIGNSYM